jgi:hypothetical protein
MGSAGIRDKLTHNYTPSTLNILRGLKGTYELSTVDSSPTFRGRLIYTPS